jgi:hypothetical protein
MEFEVEKSLLTLLTNHINDFWPGMSKELFPHFKDTHMILQEVHPTLSLCEVVNIESKDNLVFRFVHKGLNHQKSNFIDLSYKGSEDDVNE